MPRSGLSNQPFSLPKYVYPPVSHQQPASTHFIHLRRKPQHFTLPSVFVTTPRVPSSVGYIHAEPNNRYSPSLPQPSALFVLAPSGVLTPATTTYSAYRYVFCNAPIPTRRSRAAAERSEYACSRGSPCAGSPPEAAESFTDGCSLGVGSEIERGCAHRCCGGPWLHVLGLASLLSCRCCILGGFFTCCRVPWGWCC
jgi:hypothetical protein